MRTRLRTQGRVLCAILVAVLALAGAGCKKKTTDVAKGGALGSLEVPRPLLLWMAMKSPARTIDEGLALVQQFAPLPLTRAGLMDLFAQRAKLPREMLDAIDMGKPVWLLGLDDKLLKEPDPVVVALALRSRKEFEAALAKKTVKAATEGKLTVYNPKPGEVGQGVKLLITDTHVIAASSKAAYEVTETYLHEGLLKQTPAHDVVVHMVLKNILKDREKEIDRKLGQAMEQMRSNMSRSPGPVDPQSVASASERTFRQWADALKSTADAELLVDVSKERITLSLVGEAAPGGRLAQVIKRQQVGEPHGAALLPASSWFVVADRGNDAAKAENRKIWEPVLGELLKSVAPEQRDRLLKVLTEAGDQFTGDYTLAVHKAPSGQGLTLSMVSRVGDAEKSKKALTDVAAALGEWIKALLAKSAPEVPAGLKLERKAFSYKKAAGELFELHLPIPDEKKEPVEKLVGLPITFGMAFVGSHGLMALGKGAETQLKQLVEGAESGQVSGSLKENSAFKAAAGQPHRVGMFYLSLVDMLRGFEGTGLAEVETIGAALKDARVASAPSLDWGVNKERTQLDVTLRLPAEHFRAFKPIIDELQKKRGGLLGGAGGGGGAQWRDL